MSNSVCLLRYDQTKFGKKAFRVPTPYIHALLCGVQRLRASKQHDFPLLLRKQHKERVLKLRNSAEECLLRVGGSGIQKRGGSDASMHSAMFDSARVPGVKTPRRRWAFNQTAGNSFLLVTLDAKKKKAWLRQWDWEWCERTRRSERWATKKSRCAVVSPLQGLTVKQFLLLLNWMTARILARNTVTCCRRLSRDCFGDVLHNIFAKERRDDDHCTNSSRAQELGYTWLHWKSLPKTGEG